MKGKLSPAEIQRLNTFNPELAAAFLPEGARYGDQGDERRYHDTGLALSINLRSGAWFSFAKGTGGWSALGLLRLVKDCSTDEATAYGAAWLASHPGAGGALGYDDDNDISETKRRASARRAQVILDRLGPIEGTEAVSYLAKRGIAPPYPEGLLSYLANARTGEGALVARLTAADRTTGVMLTYLAGGSKSLVVPQRQRFDLEVRPDAVFLIQAATGVTDKLCDLVLAEGVEDGLSLLKLGRYYRIEAIPGVGFLKHYPVEPGTRIIVARDGDEPGSAPDKALVAGLDRLVLGGASVRVTTTPRGRDVNDLYQGKGGLAHLTKLLATAPEAILSREGEFERVARMPKLDRGPELRSISRRFDIPIDDVRKEVAKREPKQSPAPDDGEEVARSFREAPPWPGPVPALATLLQAICDELRRYLVMTDAQIIAVALWICASHLVHSPHVRLPIFPKLAIESKDPESGKSTLLMLVWNMVPRGQLYSRVTGPYLVRDVAANQTTPCLDEVQHYTDPVLLNLIDASHLRSAAYIGILVIDKSGNYVPKQFCVWGAQAMARLGEFNAAQQSRSIVIWLRPKLLGEARAHLTDGTSDTLVDLRRQLAAWAATVTSWTRPVLPKTLVNRTGDNWLPLLIVADLAGGDWPNSARASAAELMRIERQATVTQRLLSSIWQSYQPDPEKDAIQFLSTAELIEKLIADPDEDWSTMGPAGRAITPQWLRERLSHLLDPPRSTRESAFGPRGYAFRQFKDALRRYAGTHPSLDTWPNQSGSSAPTGFAAENPSKTAAYSEPDSKWDRAEIVHPPQHPAQEKPRKTAKSDPPKAFEPDVPDDLSDMEKGEDISAPDPSGASVHPEDFASDQNQANPPPPPDAPDLTERVSKKQKIVGNGAAKPASARRKRSRPPSPLTELIRAEAAAHPQLSPERLAKRLGQPLRAIKRALDDYTFPAGDAP
jgi:hypothetical protein